MHKEGGLCGKEGRKVEHECFLGGGGGGGGGERERGEGR